MTAVESPPFTLHGVFRGFFRDVFGKRRMVLRAAEGEIFLKIPKALRRELDAQLRPGAEVVVTGREVSDNGRPHRWIVGVRPLGAAAPATSPIRVCTKKNCWRGGGKALWGALEEGIAAAGAADTVRLEAVDCLGHCKHAPNLEWGGETFRHCSPRDADRILAAIAEPVTC